MILGMAGLGFTQDMTIAEMLGVGLNIPGAAPIKATMPAGGLNASGTLNAYTQNADGSWTESQSGVPVPDSILSMTELTAKPTDLPLVVSTGADRIALRLMVCQAQYANTGVYPPGCNDDAVLGYGSSPGGAAPAASAAPASRLRTLAPDHALSTSQPAVINSAVGTVPAVTSDLTAQLGTQATPVIAPATPAQNAMIGTAPPPSGSTTTGTTSGATGTPACTATYINGVCDTYLYIGAAVAALGLFFMMGKK